MRIDKRLFTYVPHMRIYLIALGGLSFLAAAMIILQAHFITTIINAVFLVKQALPQVHSLLILLLLVIGIRASLFWINEIMVNKMAMQGKSNIREQLFQHLLRLGPIFIKGERSGELVNTATEGVETLDAYFSQVLPQICATAIIPIVILLVVFLNDLLSGFVLLITLPILPIFMILIGKQAEAATQKRWYQLSHMSAHFLDVLQGATVLKLFGRNQRQKETIRRISERFGATTLQVLRIAFLSALVMEMGATISTAIVAVEIGLRLLYGQMPFASAFFILLLAPEYYQPLRALGPQFHASMSSAAGARRIFDLLDTPVQHHTVTLPATDTPQPTIKQRLNFENVSYSYQDTEDRAHPALQNISFELETGQRIALVGPSGAGKTTIAHLILRLIEPQQGSIKADGREIQHYQAQDWRKLVAWQPQQPYLFNTTVAENIRMGRADASLDEVITAAKKADLHDFILTLPHGYDTKIGERGTRLSGGQVQRLSLARALLKDAPILVLDEATSTLDAETEANILSSLSTWMQDHLVLIIAHRLHTIRSADKILVLKDGSIVDSGTHTALMQSSLIYQQLVKAYEDGELAV